MRQATQSAVGSRARAGEDMVAIKFGWDWEEQRPQAFMDESVARAATMQFLQATTRRRAWSGNPPRTIQLHRGETMIMARQSPATAWKPGRPNPGFESWPAMMDHLVEDDFLTFDVDGMLDDPYTEEGLRIAEAVALHQFPDRASVKDPRNAELADKYIRFIGQAFVRGLGLTWTDEPPFDGDPPTMSIVVPPIADGLGPIPVSVPSLLLAAVKRRTGEEWALMFHNNEQRLGNRSGLGTDNT